MPSLDSSLSIPCTYQPNTGTQTFKTNTHTHTHTHTHTWSPQTLEKNLFVPFRQTEERVWMSEKSTCDSVCVCVCVCVCCVGVCVCFLAAFPPLDNGRRKSKDRQGLLTSSLARETTHENFVMQLTDSHVVRGNPGQMKGQSLF